MPKIKKKYMIDCGELVHSIQIERKTLTTVKGIVEETWEVIYSPRCAVNNNTGSEYLKNGFVGICTLMKILKNIWYFILICTN